METLYHRQRKAPSKFELNPKRKSQFKPLFHMRAISAMMAIGKESRTNYLLKLHTSVK